MHEKVLTKPEHNRTFSKRSDTSNKHSLNKNKETSSCNSCRACKSLSSPGFSPETASSTLSHAKAMGKESCAASFMQRNYGNHFTASVLNPVVQKKCSCGGSCSRCKGEEEADRISMSIMKMESPLISYKPSSTSYQPSVNDEKSQMSEIMSNRIQKVSRLCTEERPYSEDCSRYMGSGIESCEFYKCREANNYCRCGDRGYYMGYGYKYCDRFNKLTRPRLSSSGQRWVDETTRCLQDYLNRSVAWDAPCDVAKSKAFDSHPDCYVKSGICFLPQEDWTFILDAIDSADMDLKQTIITGISCIANWLLPGLMPFHSLSAGGGLRGLYERDRERLRRETGVRLP